MKNKNFNRYDTLKALGRSALCASPVFIMGGATVGLFLVGPHAFPCGAAILGAPTVAGGLLLGASAYKRPSHKNQPSTLKNNCG